MDFSQKIRHIREKLNISQEDLARALNVSCAAINEWENSRRKPAETSQAAFADFCTKHHVVFDTADDRNLTALPAPEPMGVKSLCSFIPCFEHMSPDEACQWVEMKKNKNGVITLPYPVYSDDFLKFISAFYQSGLLAGNYQDELNQRIPDWETIDIKTVIETADFEMTIIVLTKLVRVERFSDGAWDHAIRSGLFLAILRRLKHIAE